MTVAELISRLKQTDPDRTVLVARYDGDVLFTSEVLSVHDNHASKAHDVLWLEAR